MVRDISGQESLFVMGNSAVAHIAERDFSVREYPSIDRLEQKTQLGNVLKIFGEMAMLEGFTAVSVSNPGELESRYGDGLLAISENVAKKYESLLVDAKWEFAHAFGLIAVR
ncbi:hypothetical protein KC959_04440, partial [Candidatus Saccharibacteria bacterium]|nr:hypothetical protein [Candidatus Saccharibacteria bacterium]